LHFERVANQKFLSPFHGKLHKTSRVCWITALQAKQFI
jgi:hypothetical protein